MNNLKNCHLNTTVDLTNDNQQDISNSIKSYTSKVKKMCILKPTIINT